MPLVSRDPAYIIEKSSFTHRCNGNGMPERARRFSPRCDGMIGAGDEYVVLNEGQTGWVVSRHCAHCALAFFDWVEVTR